MVWELDVQIDREKFPEYNELVEELKKIPDVVLRLEYSKLTKRVIIGIHDLEGKYEKFASITYSYVIGKVRLEIYIYKKETPDVIEKREASAENNEEAISLLVGFTRYALAKITKDIKYINESETSRDDITQIKAVEVIIYTLSKSLAGDMIESLSLTENCEIIKSYTFNMWYVYPQTARVVLGSIFCCSNRCYLYITSESQEGDVVGNKRFVIDLKGREPTEETLKEILKTRKDLLMNIEKYIRETRTK